MTHQEACRPCARRKVRCDKQEPNCTNCKRRKGDRCVYPPISPNERIRRLEALVRKLGGDPSNGGSTAVNNKQAPAQSSGAQLQVGNVADAPIEIRSADPIVLEEDGHTFYVESRVWQDWLGKGTSKNSFMSHKRPHALSDQISSYQRNHDLSITHPHFEQASMLWTVFYQRVEPLVRITFRWQLKELQDRSLNADRLKDFSDAEHALVIAIYLVSIVSLLDDECDDLLHESRFSLISQYHALCEKSLLLANIFCMVDVTVIKAVVFYMMASYDRLVSTQSLWSLMGLTLRNAEKLGLHRDGVTLGLAPHTTEERRRIWWQLQHIDLCLGISSGLTPMTLMADWDAKIPLNIEDDDMSPSATVLPQERKGLTSMSYCRYTYWAVEKQRQIFRAKQGRFALSWQSNSLLTPGVKEDVVTELEEGLNKTFLQYCDPIEPLDSLVQLAARFLIVGMRLRVLHASVFYSRKQQQIGNEQRRALFDASVQCVKYNIAIQSHQQLKKFHWLTRIMFSWHAFMFVLVEAWRENDVIRAQQTWDLLANVYATNPSLFELSEDRRRHHAAELVVAAWKAWQHRLEPSNLCTSPPEFVSRLTTGLTACKLDVDQVGTSVHEHQYDANASLIPITPESIMTEDVHAFFEIDFQDIDWSFWNSIE